MLMVCRHRPERPPRLPLGLTPERRRTASSLEVAVHDLHRVPGIRQILAESLRDGDAAMLAAGAADADREVALHLLLVRRREIRDEIEEAFVEVSVLRLLLEILDDFGIEAGLRTQRFDEVWIRQEANVEKEIEVVWRLVLEAEADHGDQHRRLVTGQVEE